ncbi:hypothetical protein HYALB_00010847 [Hymenoscyphus albidus]|uniref:Uncharacterized protein n=1 Tax=Hymenoscyphus albidus TaxID=595503 RepID=A0A9N9LHZ3_9HELO|nr:hypothetical protein HYALB_00010847 [Hymenoscyphus albidus]
MAWTCTISEAVCNEAAENQGTFAQSWQCNPTAKINTCTYDDGQTFTGGKE